MRKNYDLYSQAPTNSVFPSDFQNCRHLGGSIPSPAREALISGRGPSLALNTAGDSSSAGWHMSLLPILGLE